MTTSAAAIVDEQLTAPVVGVDVGGTKIAAALVSADGGLLGPVAEAPTPAREGAQAVLDAIASSVTTLIDTGAPAARRVRLAPVAVGIGSAGELLTAGQHGTTFGGNPVSCAAALAVLDPCDPLRSSCLLPVPASHRGKTCRPRHRRNGPPEQVSR